MTMKHGFLLLAAFALNPTAILRAGDAWNDEVKRAVADAEPRVRAIYKRREFRAASFPAEWLPDSSG
jgi:hypothetical protein